jgi:uncharacterized protein
MAGKFVLKKGTTGKFRFSLLSSNGRVVATSEAYETKAAAMRGIESVRKNASGAKLDDQTEKANARGATVRRRGQSNGGAGRALKRDWEQTKSDLPGLKGKDLNQDIGDTVEQATGKKAAPPASRRNPRS